MLAHRVRKLSKPGSAVPDIKRTGLDRLIETGWCADKIEVQWLVVIGEGTQRKLNCLCLWQRAPF